MPKDHWFKVIRPLDIKDDLLLKLEPLPKSPNSTDQIGSDVTN